MNVRKEKKNKGITLIALIITIIVLLILAGVSLSTLVGDNGILTNAQTATIKTKFTSYKEELGMNAMDDTGIYASGNKLKQFIHNIQDQDIDKFVIIKSKLIYIGNNEFEANVAKSIGLGGVDGEASDSSAAIKEIQSIISGVIDVKDEFKSKIPTDDEALLTETEHTNNADGLIGTRLFDRNELNMTNHTWNILDEYNTKNEKTVRYGTGYYWLKKGTIYKINGEDIEFKNNYVVDYSKNEYIVVSGRAVNWNETATLAVADGLVLNVDPMSLANGEWKNNTTNKTYEQELAIANNIEDEETRATELNNVRNQNFYNFYVTNPKTNVQTDTGIQKTGDVVYDSSSKALKFNESSYNTAGEGGYLKELGTGIDFKDGFTFELYGNMSRLRYRNGVNSVAKYMSLFCRIPSLTSFYGNSLRFGYTERNGICKFFSSSSWVGSGEGLYTQSYLDYYTVDGMVITLDGLGYTSGDEVFIQYIYIAFDETKNVNYKSKYYDEYMIQNKVDKLLYYINGRLFGYTYYGSDSYEAGLSVWGGNDCPFFLGVCPWDSNGNLYYLKGKVYSTRLYQVPMSTDEVKKSYDLTLKYRSSF